MKISLTVDISKADRALSEITARLQNLIPFTTAIAGEVQDRIDSAFAGEFDPVTHESWPGLKPLTLARRVQDGHDGPILQVTRTLRQGTLVTPQDKAVEVTTAVEYGQAHQYGYPPRNLPQRRYAGVSPDDVSQFEAQLRAFILG